MIWSIGALLVALLMSSPVQAENTKDEILTRIRAYDVAVKAHDLKAVDKLVDNDGHFILDDGQMCDKRRYIASFMDNKLKYQTVKANVGSLRVFGDTAIEMGTWTATGKTEGKPFRYRVRYTVVWIKKDGAWVVTSDQATKIADGK